MDDLDEEWNVAPSVNPKVFWDDEFGWTFRCQHVTPHRCGYNLTWNEVFKIALNHSLRYHPQFD